MLMLVADLSRFNRIYSERPVKLVKSEIKTHQIDSVVKQGNQLPMSNIYTKQFIIEKLFTKYKASWIRRV